MRSLKSFLFLALILALLSSASFGQGTAATGNPVVVNGVGQPMGGVTAAICVSNPGATPGALCSGANLATLYTDITLSVPCTGTLQALNNQNLPSVGGGCSNPGLTDGQGNVVAFSNPGTFWCEYTGSNIIGISVSVCPFPALVGSSFNPAAPGAIGGTTPSTGAFTSVTATNGVQSPPPAWPYLAIAQDPQAACAYPLNYFNASQMQICNFGGNGYLNFGLGNQQIVTTINGTPNFPGAVPTWQNSISGIQSGYLPGAPMYIPNQVPGGAIIGGSDGLGNSTLSFGAVDAIRVSGWCNNGMSGGISTLACLNYTDPAVAIQAIVTKYGTRSSLNIIYDMCGIQPWSVQPFVGSGSNVLVGTFEIASNCPGSTPSIISLDGISTLLTNGIQINGHGALAQDSQTPQYGAVSGLVTGSYIRACNPAIYPCLHGGFQIQSGTVASTGALAGTSCVGSFSCLSLATMTGAPFTTSTAAVNHIGFGRLLHIVGSACPTNNAAWIINDVVSTTAPQTMHVTAPTGWAACATSATGYLDTPVIAIGSGGNGVFGNQINNLTVDCSFMPGCDGWVNGAGQELNSISFVNAFNTTVFGGRIDQSCAYAGVNTCTGATNSGPYGPFSNNVQSITCGLTGGCGCMGASTGCSSAVAGTPGTVPLGTRMSVGASGSMATISPDPAVNGNYACFLFTGGTGQQGFGPMSHITCTISDKSAPGATAVPQMQGGTTGAAVTYTHGGIVGTTRSCGLGFFGIHASNISDVHTEYVNTGFCFGGNPARSGTYYYAYTGGVSTPAPAPTSGIQINGGFAQVTGSTPVMFDLGGAKTDAPFIGDIRVNDFNAMNGSGAIIWQNNITGETCTSYSTAPGSDFVFSGFFGHSSTVAQSNNGETGLAMMQEQTSCTNLAHFTGNAFSVPLVSTGAISNYGVPVKADTSNAGQFVATVTTDTAAGIVMGVSYHSTAAGGFGQVVTTGVVPMLFGTSGTGNCAIGNFVVVDSTTNGHVKCATYTAGTVIGIALQAMTTTNTPFNVLVGLR